MATGQAGIEFMRRNGAELVTLDLNLPDIDGVEICEQLRYEGSVHLTLADAMGRGWGQP